METWMIERLRRQQEERQQRVPVHITPPQPAWNDDQRHPQEESNERGYCIVEF